MVEKMVKIWKPELTNILPGAKIGNGTTIGAFVEIGKDVIIGQNCKIQAMVFIPKGVEIYDSVFIGPCVCFTNDRYPSSTEYGKFERTIVEAGANIGAGSTIRCGVRIGSNSTLGAGSTLTKDIPAGETWIGNPARRMI